MLAACIRPRLRSPTITTKFPPFLTNQISSLSQNPTLNMKPEPKPKPKRPTCPNCAKPIALCLCSRLKTPHLDNKIHITILQHKLEKKHPLNSAKIAKFGLKNVDVFTVNDVLFGAHFDIWPLGLNCGLGLSDDECVLRVCENASEGLGSDESFEVMSCRKQFSGHACDVDLSNGSDKISESERVSGCVEHECVGEVVGFEGGGEVLSKEGDCISKATNAKLNDEPVLSLEIAKQGKITNLSHRWKVEDEREGLEFEQLIACPEAVKSLAGGFVVKSWKGKQKSGTLELEQSEEFEIRVPPGSALLFPSKNAVAMEDVDFEVRNLIVLDGTWAKAKKMYNENPWLKILPSVRLDVEKKSLYCEVRMQPKPGCLSSVESIVYALKALGEGDNLEGLDNLLEVLVSMVEDQRRCKDERLQKISST